MARIAWRVPASPAIPSLTALDTIFNNAASSGTSTSTAPYLGLGSVNFTYQISGGVNSLEGGLNYLAGPTTIYWGQFHLTYYWCPAAPPGYHHRRFYRGSQQEQHPPPAMACYKPRTKYHI